MMPSQAIERPIGVSVFGSSIIRVEPDLASISCAVTRLNQLPKDAFHEAHESAQAIANFLAQAKLTDVGTSRVTLVKTYHYNNSVQTFVGYTAKAAFNVLLHDLDRMEEILIGLVEAGVNELEAVKFQTSRLKEFRAQARRQAVEAAREKAENYCKTAGVQLGPVIHIEDVNPDILRGREGHVIVEMQPDDAGEIHAFDPGSIAVGGAVIVAFQIGRRE